MIQYNNIFREIRQAVGLSWTEPRSPPFGFYPYFLLTQATSSITTYALADTSAGAFLWLSPRGDEFWANRGIWPCFEGGFISILPASLCSVDLCIERFCSPVLHWLGFVIPSTFRFGRRWLHGVDVPYPLGLSVVHRRICLLITLGLWFCRDVSWGILVWRARRQHCIYIAKLASLSTLEKGKTRSPQQSSFFLSCLWKKSIALWTLVG